MKEASLPGQVEWSARREIRNTLKSCVPRAPLTHDAETRACGKWEIGKTLAARRREEAYTPREKRAA
ncbi:hypothetical protein GCM10011391_35050 [Pullulanibacillus camelliae]|uniref:Uncharacterized protein n=1 Tax=Pullulanibacillus camelliae TaxID=1707096 RepID=A0A8J3E159_9BACL|nr:hypothetical protein GCM10011391_35050 [Pullulanibacillus camelliae]